MVVHKCERCLEEFVKKSHYIQHINKKKQCQIIIKNISNHSKSFQNIPESFQNIPESFQNKENSHSCKFCFKDFSTGFNLNKHVKNSCKVKKLEDEKKENIYNNLLEKEKINNLFNMYDELKKNNDELKKSNEELNKKNEELNKRIEEIVKKNTGNTQNITNIQIINNNYKINPFGKESYDKLNKKDILKIMTDTKNNGKHCFNKLIDLIHFNSNIPENQNIYMGDYNRNKFMVHDGKDWNLSQNEEFIVFQVLEHVRKLYFSKIDDEEFEQKFEYDRNFRNEFNTTFKKYYDYVFDEVDDNMLSIQELQKKRDFKEMMNNEVKNKLYNKKKFVIDTFEKNKNNLLT